MVSKFINRGKRKILEVDGKPFVALAGEIHNSDYTSVEYMEHIWKIADDLGMNTLLIPNFIWRPLRKCDIQKPHAATERRLPHVRSVI